MSYHIDHSRHELTICLDNYLCTADDQAIASSLAAACVGPGKSIRCIEEDGMIVNTIRVKIDPDSVLGKAVTDTS